MTDEIVKLINERRRYKNQTNAQEQQQYKRIRNEVQRKIKKAKEKWLDEQCKGIENFFKKGRSDLAFSETKKLFREKKQNAGTLVNKNGELLLEADQRAKRWKEYLEELYEDNSTMIFAEEDNVDEDDKGDYILQAEFDHAMDSLKNNKAYGVDEIPAELLKYTDVVVKKDCTKYAMKYI